MKDKVINTLKNALEELSFPSDKVIIQNTKNPEHGDFASNIAMILAGKLKQPPQQIADSIINKLLEQNSDNLFIEIKKAGPGFINFKLNKNLFHNQPFQIFTCFRSSIFN